MYKDINHLNREIKKNSPNPLGKVKVYYKALVLLCAGTVLGLLLFLPRVHYQIGNIFFGDVPILYNVTFAEFFFTIATHPVIGNVPPYAHHQLSRTYFIQGNLKQALAEAFKEIKFYPDHWPTFYIIGLTLGYMNHEVSAIDAFGVYIDKNPMSWAARNDRAWLQFRIGDIDGALETIQPVVHLTDNPWVQNTYGTLLMNKEKNTEAWNAFLLAQVEVNKMSKETWGSAYPGNDPRIYVQGLDAMKASIATNIKLLETR